MKKVCKFYKFSKFFLIFALVFTVGLVPTVAKASTIVSQDEYRTYYQVQILSYGKWVDVFYEDSVIYDDYSYVYDFDSADVDQTDGDNIRFRIYYELRSEEGYTYTISDYFESGIEYDDFSLSNFTCNIYGAVSDYVFGSHFKPIISDIAFSGDGYPAFSLDIVCTEGYCGFMLEFSTNMHKTFPSTVGAQQMQAYFMSGSPFIYINSSSKIPSVGSPDIDDFPDVDEYLPKDNNAFMKVFSQFTSLPFVSTSLFIVTIVGVVSYVLFGRKS